MPSKEAKITLVLPEEQKELLQRRAKAKDLSLNKYLLSVIFPKEDKKEIENAILLKNVLDKQIDIIRTCYQALDNRLRSILSVSAKNVGIGARIYDDMLAYCVKMTDEQRNQQMDEINSYSDELASNYCKKVFDR